MPKGINTREKKVYFGTDEWETVCKKAAAAEMKIGTYIRYIAVHGIVKKYDVDALSVFASSINRVGNNINQISKTANASGSVFQKDVDDLKSDFDKLRIILDRCIKYLSVEENS